MALLQAGQIKLRRRLRLGLALAACVGGVAVAALSRWRPERVRRFWEPPHRILSRIALDPSRAYTDRLAGSLARAGVLWKVEADNAALRQTNTGLQLTNDLLKERIDRIERLTGLGRWGGPPDVVFTPAQVVGGDFREAAALLFIDRGESDGLRRLDPVAALDGLVGLVRSVSSRGAVVQFLSDPQSAVGALSIDAEGRRTRGVVHGRGVGAPLEFVPENEVDPILPGARVITSGFDNSLVPKGLPIGSIQGRRVDGYGLPYGEVAATVNLQRLEEVLVIVPSDRAAEGSLPPAYFVDPATTATRGLEIIMPTGAPATNDEATTSAAQTDDIPTTATTGDAATTAPRVADAPTTETGRAP